MGIFKSDFAIIVLFILHKSFVDTSMSSQELMNILHANELQGLMSVSLENSLSPGLHRVEEPLAPVHCSPSLPCTARGREATNRLGCSSLMKSPDEEL